jgi:hypothetical protein
VLSQHTKLRVNRIAPNVAVTFVRHPYPPWGASLNGSARLPRSGRALLPFIAAKPPRADSRAARGFVIPAGRYRGALPRHASPGTRQAGRNVQAQCAPGGQFLERLGNSKNELLRASRSAGSFPLIRGPRTPGSSTGPGLFGRRLSSTVGYVFARLRTAHDRHRNKRVVACLEQVSVPLPAELRQFVRSVAAREERSQAAVIRRLVRAAARHAGDEQDEEGRP